jgi:glycosyltransferase involved in cell wall biosynthesis
MVYISSAPKLKRPGSCPTVPSVSVILPTFNRTKFLKLAIESVYAQTYADWEIVVADDGSGEEARSYLQSIADPRVRIIWLPHSGNPSLVRNAAIKAANGRFLAFLDSDDTWAPLKLEKQVGALRDHANSRWSYTACDQIDEHGFPIAKKHLRPIVRPEGWIFEKLLTLEIGIAMPTVVAERDLVNEIGGFDEQQRFGEFHDLCLRLAMKGEVVVVRESLCSVRTHNEHYSSDKIGDHAGWMRLYEKMANLTTVPRLRAHCAKMRAETSLRLAREHAVNGDSRGALTTLRRASSFAWRYPHWWWGALKVIVRPIIPRAMISALRYRGGTFS